MEIERIAEKNGEEEEEEVVKETRECLPYWIKQGQVMNLLHSCNSNIVEAVSLFYEHETEFHDEAFTTSEYKEDASPPSPPPPPPTVTNTVDDCKPVTAVLKCQISPVVGVSKWGKKKKKKKKNGLQKTGMSSPLGLGSKQHEITRFFLKKTGMSTGQSA